ncbi:MAG: acyltransferase family protein [Clostridia bacterium]|nr:acyltransferase family protein [Clostridia bacterium]
MQNTKENRSPAMDVIRCFALLCVISVHFFTNSGFYMERIDGPVMHLMTWMRASMMICVPLFLMLSGFLLAHKKPDKAYYGKSIKTIAIYLMASAVCMAYRRIFHSHSVDYSLHGALKALFGYSGAPYAWYVEMYLGLFLIIPFLNLCYCAVESKRGKQGLILALFAISILPNDVNAFVLSRASWWTNPASSSDYFKILPSFWVDLYPIVYYFVGSYLREYPLKMKKDKHLICILLVFVAAGMYNSYRCAGSAFIAGAWTGYGSTFVFIQSILVFSYIQQCSFVWMSGWMKKLFARLSDACLGAYLVSFVFDTRFYMILLEKVPTFRERLIWFPVVVLAVFVCSLLLSCVLTQFYNRCADLCVSRRKRKYGAD